MGESSQTAGYGKNELVLASSGIGGCHGKRTRLGWGPGRVGAMSAVMFGGTYVAQ
jgi:hypothetical protein